MVSDEQVAQAQARAERDMAVRTADRPVVVVFVRGGAVEDVQASRRVNVIVVDYDVPDAEEPQTIGGERASVYDRWFNPGPLDDSAAEAYDLAH